VITFVIYILEKHMFENLSERLEKSFKLLKGQGRISEINISETFFISVPVELPINWAYARNLY